jgi:hypothetical protein
MRTKGGQEGGIHSVLVLDRGVAVVFNFNAFPVLPSKAQSLGDVPMNRNNAANCSPPF